MCECYELFSYENKLFKSGDPPDNFYAIQHKIKKKLSQKTLHSNLKLW
jgi:hypothetical protein